MFVKYNNFCQDHATQNLLASIPFESIIEVKGTVLARPKEMINKNQKTGEIEVLADTFKVVNKSNEVLPFNIREFQRAKESLRMQYRYLDLRFPEMQRNLRMRSEVLMKMREFLTNNHFVDVETPTLFKATPGVSCAFFQKNICYWVILGCSRVYCTYKVPRTILFTRTEPTAVQTNVDGWRHR